MFYDEFFDQLAERLTKLRNTQREAIDTGADLVVASFDEGRKTHIFGSGHSALVTQDASVRAGSLALFNPIFAPGLLATDFPFLRAGLLERLSGIAAAVLDTSEVEAGDTLIVVSNSGRNHVPIEMAVDARERGMRTIAVTGLETALSQPSRHSSGKHLHELCDVVIDTHVPVGDAVVDIPGIPARLGPVSTILAAASVHALAASVAQKLHARGIKPPVLVSGNVDGGDDYSLDVLERHRHLTTYLTGMPTRWTKGATQ